MALLLVFLGSLLAYKIDLPDADDMARHIKNGELIVHGQFDVLYRNFYSYTLPNQQFVNHHWMSGVIFYLLHQAVGWNGLVIFKILIFLATFCILFAAARKKASFWPVAIFSIPTIFIMNERLNLRPEMFSYLFLSIFLYVLADLDVHPEAKKIYWLIPIEILWVNNHLFFPIGVALVGGYLFEKLLIHRKDWRTNPLVRKTTVVLGLLVLACLVNPNFINGALYPLHIFNNYGIDVSENHGPVYFWRTGTLTADPALLAFAISSVALILSFVAGFRRKQKPIYLFLGAIATTVGGFLIIRFLTLFSFIFLPAITNNLEDIYRAVLMFLKKYNWLGYVKVFAIVATVLLLGFFVVTNRPLHTKHGLGLTAHSNDPAAFITQNNLQGPIFNDYDIGSYLIYNVFPKEKVFLDNRPEAYTVDFFKNTYLPMIQDEDVWQEELAHYQFNTIVLYRYDEGEGVQQFMYARAKDPQWALVYSDGEAVIFLRRNELNKDIIQHFEITPDNVLQRVEYLRTADSYEDRVAAADAYNLANRPDLAMEQFFDVVSKWPRAGKIWMVMGEWELQNNDPKSPLVAVLDELNGIANGQGTAQAYTDLAQAYLRLKKFGLAKTALDHALKIDSHNQEAQNLLESITQ